MDDSIERRSYKDRRDAVVDRRLALNRHRGPGRTLGKTPQEYHIGRMAVGEKLLCLGSKLRHQFHSSAPSARHVSVVYRRRRRAQTPPALTQQIARYCFSIRHTPALSTPLDQRLVN